MNTLIAVLTAREGSEDTLLHELLGLVAPTAHEAGTVDYQIHRGEPGSRTVVVYERYRDAAALEAHMRQHHVVETLKRCEPLLAAPPELVRGRREDGLPLRVDAGGQSATVYVIPLGPANLVFARTARGGVLACGAVDPAALGRFGIAAARARPARGPSIANADDLLEAEVAEVNDIARRNGVDCGMSGRDALRRL